MKPTVAPCNTYGTLDADVTVESGGSVRVYSISIWNGTGAPQKVQLKRYDTSAVFADIAVASGSTEIYDVKFLADGGLTVASLGDANSSVTVYHSHAGS